MSPPFLPDDYHTYPMVDNEQPWSTDLPFTSDWWKTWSTDLPFTSDWWKTLDIWLNILVE